MYFGSLACLVSVSLVANSVLNSGTDYCVSQACWLRLRNSRPFYLPVWFGTPSHTTGVGLLAVLLRSLTSRGSERFPPASSLQRHAHTHTEACVCTHRHVHTHTHNTSFQLLVSTENPPLWTVPVRWKPRKGNISMLGSYSPG